MADNKDKRYQIKADQIKGIHGGSLYDDIDKLISDVFGEFKFPVNTVDDLPDTDDIGTTRFVNSVGKYYQLVGKTINGITVKVWETIPDLKTETRSTKLIVDSNNQITFTTNLGVGIINGIANLNSVSFIVNGIEQNSGSDFIVSKNENNKLVINWESTDFQLDTTDDIKVVYDILTQ